MPALLKSRSSRPKRARTLAKRASTAPGSVTSVGHGERARSRAPRSARSARAPRGGGPRARRVAVREQRERGGPADAGAGPGHDGDPRGTLAIAAHPGTSAASAPTPSSCRSRKRARVARAGPRHPLCCGANESTRRSWSRSLSLIACLLGGQGASAGAAPAPSSPSAGGRRQDGHEVGDAYVAFALPRLSEAECRA